ncbi:dihydrolipoamide acetyltransferase family protein [Jannaschia sp. R86511]|uniref:dihydrolipoamide acetyltransferase family protein n=1 Tax=Jannaschia sp. R86511 TaxID=3093853 RepID=UPI0036D289B2
MSVQSTGATGTVEHYRMPDAGEGLTEAEVVTWRVAVGDVVDVNDVVVEVETAKSLVELPCPFAGTVVELMAAEGETVAVGTPILAVRTSEGDAAPSGPGAGAAAGAGPAADAHPAAGQDEGEGEPAVGDAAPADDTGAPVGPSAVTAAHPSTQAAAGAGRTAVLVGYGPAAGATRRRARRAVAGSAPPGSAASAEDAPVTAAPVVSSATDDAGRPVKVLAKPPVRKLAKDLGVDLGTVTPTGPGGVVSRADVEAAAAGAGGPDDGPDAPDGTTGSPTGTPGTGAAGGVGAERVTTRIPVKGVRKHTAAAMVASAFTAPHVTEWVQVDVTASVRLLERLKADRAMRDVRLSPFTLVARAMCLAARRHPTVNVSWDEVAQEIVVHGQVNLGFAAATERGLVVPVVERADAHDLAGLAGAIGELVDTARAGRLQPAQQAGGTLTVTNVGVFGVDGGTPILPPGTGLILACGQVRRMPWVVGTGADEQVVPRDVMTLAVSFDHRMIDGELGSRYLADVARVLEDPGYALAWT